LLAGPANGSIVPNPGRVSADPLAPAHGSASRGVVVGCPSHSIMTGRALANTAQLDVGAGLSLMPWTFLGQPRAGAVRTCAVVVGPLLSRR